MNGSISTSDKKITLTLAFELHEAALVRELPALGSEYEGCDTLIEVCDLLREHLLSVLPELLDQVNSQLRTETCKFWGNFYSSCKGAARPGT